MRDKALEWIEKQIRQARQALGRSEYKPGVKPEELENLRAKIELLEFISGAVLKADGADGWISVKDRLPEPEQEVLAVCRKRYGSLVVPAIYENGEVNTDDSNWHWYDCDFTYDEENDVYIIPEGWWENRHFNPEDTFNCPIDVTVTHWMPLPERPKEE